MRTEDCKAGQHGACLGTVELAAEKRTRPCTCACHKARPVRPVTDRAERAAHEAVQRRSKGRCEVRAPGCTGAATGRHHRLMESQGGPTTPENLVAVCANCHTDSEEAIHRNVARSYALGLLIRQSAGPPSVPWSPENPENALESWR